MLLRFRQVIAVLVLCGLTSVYLNGMRILNPADSGAHYLTDLKYANKESALNRFLFGKRDDWGYSSAYLAISNEYETQKNYGLLDARSEASYHQRFAALALSASQSWQNYQTHLALSSAAHGVDDRYELEKWFKGNTPAMALATLAAAYSGKTMRYRLNQKISLESRSILSGSKLQGQYLGWSSSSLEASAGATYTSSGQNAWNFRKQITAEVSISYEKQDDHSVGVSYSRGF